MMLTNPLNIPYHLSLMWKLFSPKLVVKKIALIVYYSFRPKDQSRDAVIFNPMHKQAQLTQVPITHASDV